MTTTLTEYFPGIAPIDFEGPESRSPLALRYYEADREVLGRTMKEHLRFAVCYWHTLGWSGGDMFGVETFDRPWNRGADAMARAREKTRAAFELLEKLRVPFFTFHDVDVAPPGDTLAASLANLDEIVDLLGQEMERTGIRLLWGTANLFSHPRYAAGAATNPDPEVFAYAAAQVKHIFEATHRLGGENYVVWGGREGYDTLLNTDLRRESQQMARFLSLIAEHKHRIGFKGDLLVEPKPQEPTKHQYDFDVATVYGFLQRHGLEKEYKVNIEVNHAELAGHTFEHEIAVAVNHDFFGSVDANRGDPQCGWDTDQFPTDVGSATRAIHEILSAGGFTRGGFNFDAKLRRQSIDLEDLFYAHIGGMDTLARGLLNAASMIQDGVLKAFVEERYRDWGEDLGRAILDGSANLDTLYSLVLEEGLDPKPRSGRQEYLENLVNRYL